MNIKNFGRIIFSAFGKNMPIAAEGRFAKADKIYDKNGYKTIFKIIEPDILYAESSGRLEEDNIDGIIEIYRSMLTQIFQNAQRYGSILNWSSLQTTKKSVRKRFGKELEKLNTAFPCYGCVIYGSTRLIKAFIIVARHLFRFPLEAAADFDKALTILEKKRALVDKKSLFIPKQKSTIPYSQNDIDKLLYFIGSINWDNPGFSDSTDNFPDNHSLKPIYESMAIIKHDFDAILSEKKAAEKLILEDNKLNQLRADVWRLASDKNSSVLNFINDLLQVILQSLDIDRVEYLEHLEDKKTFTCLAVCQKQTIPSTVGISVPFTMMELYTELACSVLSDATLATRFTHHEPGCVTAVLHSLKENYAAHKAFCVPFFINDTLRGIFLLSYCAPEPQSSLVTRDLVTRVGYEMTTIAAAYIARKTAEDELTAAYESLEDRVLQRTKELVHVNKELMLARKAAESASEAKSQFLANMSHEIRTPLNAVIGFSEIIHSSPDATQHREYAQNILSESRRLLELLNTILDISKIESGKMEVSSQAFSLVTCIKDLSASYGTQAKQKSLTFDYSYDESVPLAITADAIKIKQILVNLIGNSIKFTERGKVSLSVKPGASANHVRFEVLDTGIGMSKEAQAKLFKPFEQADASITRKYGGTGLGTAISMLLVRLMKGEMGVESQEGFGSLFWIELPFEPAPVKFCEVPTTVVSGNASFKGKKVLLVEDYIPNQEIATFFLKSAEASITIAENGLEAVSQAQEIKFNLILMDVQMPLMDGLTASREIRGIEKNKHTPIIGMTAYAFASDRDKCLAAGMNSVITKPVDWHKALGALYQAMHGKMEPAAMEDAGAGISGNTSVPINMDNYVKRMNGNKKIALDILLGFLKILPGDIVHITEALSSGNAREANRLAHSIKGGGRNVCAEELAEAAWKLEASLELGICDDATGLFENLKNAHVKLQEYIDKNK